MRLSFSISVGLAVVLLAGCSFDESKPDQNLRSAAIVRDQIGRFAIIPAQSNVPTMLLDTATGCVFSINRAEDGKMVLYEVPFAAVNRSCSELRQLDVVYNGVKL